MDAEGGPDRAALFPLSPGGGFFAEQEAVSMRPSAASRRQSTPRCTTV